MTLNGRANLPAVPLGRFATLLLCSAGAMLFLALMATLFVLREEQTLLFRAHSGLLPKTLQTLGTALLLCACGGAMLASRFKNMVTSDRNLRAYTSLTLVGVVVCGLAFVVVTAREWTLMFDRATVVSRAPADVFQPDVTRKARPAARTTRTPEPVSRPAESLYVTDAAIEQAGPDYVLEGVTAPLPDDVEFDVYRISRPEIAGWSDAVSGRMRVRATDVVTLERHGPHKNVVYASYFALSATTLLLTVGLTLTTIVLLARHLLRKRVYETAANVAILWGFVATAWVFCRMTL